MKVAVDSRGLLIEDDFLARCAARCAVRGGAEECFELSVLWIESVQQLGLLQLELLLRQRAHLLEFIEVLYLAHHIVLNRGCSGWGTCSCVLVSPGHVDDNVLTRVRWQDARVRELEALIIADMKRLVGHQQKIEALGERDDGGNEGPAKEDVQDSKYGLTQVEAMDADASTDEREDAGSSLVLHLDSFLSSSAESRSATEPEGSGSAVSALL